MGMTDPIADMLTRIRNASRARHQKVAIPWSRVKENIIKVLIEEGYLRESKKVKASQGAGEELVIQLKFDRENRPVIAGIKRVITEKAVYAAMNLIGSTPGHDVDGCTACGAQFRVIVATVHLKLLHRILAHRWAHAACIVVRFAAIHRNVVSTPVASIQREAALRRLDHTEVRVFRETVRIADAGRQQGKSKVVPPVNG